MAVVANLMYKTLLLAREIVIVRRDGNKLVGIVTYTTRLCGYLHSLLTQINHFIPINPVFNVKNFIFRHV